MHFIFCVANAYTCCILVLTNVQCTVSISIFGSEVASERRQADIYFISLVNVLFSRIIALISFKYIFVTDDIALAPCY